MLPYVIIKIFDAFVRRCSLMKTKIEAPNAPVVMLE